MIVKYFVNKTLSMINIMLAPLLLPNHPKYTFSLETELLLRVAFNGKTVIFCW